MSIVLSTPAASATLTWKSPTSAPWTGSCWAQQPLPARRPSGSAALPSHLPSSPPGTTSGSFSTLMPPAPARPRASVCHTFEVMLAATGLGAPHGAPRARAAPSTSPLPSESPPAAPAVRAQWWDRVLPQGALQPPQGHGPHSTGLARVNGGSSVLPSSGQGLSPPWHSRGSLSLRWPWRGQGSFSRAPASVLGPAEALLG